MGTEQGSVQGSGQEHPHRVMAVTNTEVVVDTVTVMARDVEAAKQAFTVEYAGTIKETGSKEVRIIVRPF